MHKNTLLEGLQNLPFEHMPRFMYCSETFQCKRSFAGAQDDRMGTQYDRRDTQDDRARHSRRQDGIHNDRKDGMQKVSC